MSQQAAIPLISREVLFGNPDRAAVRLSPDGAHLSFLAPVEGVLNFRRPENRLSFTAVAEAFLASCLEGRYEPIGSAFEGSSIKMLCGAEQVPGLAET